MIKSGIFEAASFDVEATEFEQKNSRRLILALAAVVGSIIGLVYVLIASDARQRRQRRDRPI